MELQTRILKTKNLFNENNLKEENKEFIKLKENGSLEKLSKRSRDGKEGSSYSHLQILNMSNKDDHNKVIFRFLIILSTKTVYSRLLLVFVFMPLTILTIKY